MLPELTSNPDPVQWTIQLYSVLSGCSQVIFCLLLKIQKESGNNQHHKQQGKSMPNSSTEIKTVSATQQALNKFSEQVNVLKQ